MGWAALVALGPIAVTLALLAWLPGFDLVEDDGVSLTQPLLTDAFSQLQSGRIPWWSHSTGCGYPLLGRCYWGLFPLHAVSRGLCLLFGLANQEIAVSHLLSLGLGAFFAFLYLRYCQVGRVLAATGAFAYGFNGSLLGLAINWNDYAYWIAYVPLAFLIVEQIAVRGQRSWFWPAWAALIGCLVYLSGGVVGLFKLSILVGVYFLLRGDWAYFRATVLRLSVAGIAILVACGGPILANAEWLRMTTRIPEGGLDPVASLAVFACAPEFYRGFFYPMIEFRWFGGFNLAMFEDRVGRFNGAGVFVGPLAPLALCVALANFFRRGVHRTLVVLFFVYLFLSLGSHWEGNLLLSHLPFFKHYRWPARWTIEFCAIAALLVGPGLELGWKYRQERSTRAAVAAFLVLLVLAVTVRPGLTEEWEFIFRPMFLVWLLASLVLIYLFWKGERLAFDRLALVLTVAALVATVPGAQRHRWGLLTHLADNPLPYGVGEEERVLLLANREEQRGPRTEGNYAYCLPHVLGTRTVLTYGPFQLANQEWQAGINMFGEMIDQDAAVRSFLRGHMLDLLRVRYVVVSRSNEELNRACRANPHLQFVQATASKAVYRNDGFRAPAFFIRELRPQSALASLPDLGLNNLAEVAFTSDDSSGARTFTGTGTVSDFREEHGEITLRTEAPEDQFLVVSTTWYPHWHATVDGQETAVRRVDGSFIGLRVPAGSHSIRLEFWPTMLAYLYLFDGVVLASLAAYCTVGAVRRLQRSAALPDLRDKLTELTDNRAVNLKPVP